jgi:dTDP-4-dehydrorhamnose 3,5-epimerase
MSIKVLPTSLPGVVIVEPARHGDDRGFFAEVYQRMRFVEHGLTEEFVQDNHSRSVEGVIRGLHFQDMTAPMVKLVRCTRGRILDVVVDLRVGSPAFGRWVAVELTDDNLRQLWVPIGFGHGFATLSPLADVHYRCSGYYVPAAEHVVAWNDPDIGIEWPVSDPILSPRDRVGVSLRTYLEAPSFRIDAGAPAGDGRVEP